MAETETDNLTQDEAALLRRVEEVFHNNNLLVHYEK